jgi:hypothetical protein
LARHRLSTRRSFMRRLVGDDGKFDTEGKCKIVSAQKILKEQIED